MSKNIEFKPVLTRVSSEIRFRPTLNSWESVIEAAKRLEDSYDEWQIKESKPDDILLFSPDKKASVRLCYNRILYAKEDVTEADVQKMNAQMKEAFDIIVVKSKIRQIAHIGFRKISVYETKLKLSELTDVIYSNFYNTTEISSLPFTVNDLQIVLDGKSPNGDLGNHLRFGPMDSKQAWSVFDSPFQEVNELASDKSFLFLDVDSFSKKNTSLDSVLTEKDKCIDNNSEVVSSVISKLEL